MAVDTLAKRYERTMARIEQIVRDGYNVKIQCECTFDEAMITEENPELLTHPVLRHSPLKTHIGLYGGRTEAMYLHYKISENETIEYCDVMSLYPYICKYFKFPVVHPIIHVGKTCKDVGACLKMNGLMKCTIVAPKCLNHSVLPYRWNKKLLFSLCSSCVHGQNTTNECHHVTDADRALDGTWVIDDVRLAVEKSYKVLEIHELYEYQVTQ
jgi:hypothetical protein